jgi:hypothetical protein
MENLGTFYFHLEHIMAIWYMLWPFGNLVVIWYNLPRFGTLCQEKIWQLCAQPKNCLCAAIFIPLYL